MKRTLETPGLSQRGVLTPDRGAITWEYRFCDSTELNATGITAEGWHVASSTLRKDARRVFLLKRPRS